MDETESPWALQLAARVEKLNPPAVAAVCAAAALATIALLDDERSRPGGEWHSAVAAWNGERIRKLVRRGRASAWERAQGAAGVTAKRDGAEVRAFVPSPMNQVPREVAKLQIQASPLDCVAVTDELPGGAAGVLVIAVTPLVEMSWGKQAAQCAHAAQRTWMTTPSDAVDRWDAAGRPIVVVHPSEALWAALDVAELAGETVTHIHDGGFTEIPSGTNTTRSFFGV